MTGVAPGWYKDPAEPTTQRYWDGDGWLGAPLPVDAEPPPGPPANGTGPATVQATSPPAATRPVGPLPGSGQHTGGGPRTGVRPSPAEPGTRPGEGQPTPMAAGPTVATAPPAPGPPGPPAHPGRAAPTETGARRPGSVPPEWMYPRQRPAGPAKPHGLPIATPGARLIARLIDIGAVGGLALVANAWFLYQLGRDFAEVYRAAAQQARPDQATADRFSTLLVLVILITTAIWLAYEVPAVAHTGQTFGKRILRIKVMRVESTDRVGVGRALSRWMPLGPFTVFWLCGGVGLVFQLIDCLFVVLDKGPYQQALHDKRANTLVVHIGHPQLPERPGGAP